jgi:hypothetical protein
MGRFDRRTRGGRSSDPKQRSHSARDCEGGPDHHHPAKSGHERFIDCATDLLLCFGIQILRDVDGRELDRLSL